MDSIITQVNREDEQLNAFANDKGNEAFGDYAILNSCPNICVDEKRRCCSGVLHYPGLLNSLEEN